MKIAILGPANSIHVSRWCNALAQQDIEVHLVTQHDFDVHQYSDRVRVHLLPYRGGKGYFLNRRALGKVLAEMSPDLLNCHYASGYGTLMAGVWRGPSLLSVWGADVYEFPYESRFKMWLIKRNLQAASRIASTSHVMAEQTRSLCPELAPIFVTPFGIDTARFVPVPRAADGRLVIGTVKTMAKKYGIDILIHGYALLRQRLQDEKADDLLGRLELLLVGGGGETAVLQALVAQLGLEASVTFAGQVDHTAVPDWLNRLDIYVAASRNDSESFGVAILEASSCALPVVVSRMGGLPEVVAENETGLIIPNENPQALADALYLLVQDSALRNRLGVAGRARVCQQFSWDHCVTLMRDAYRQTVAA